MLDQTVRWKYFTHSSRLFALSGQGYGADENRLQLNQVKVPLDDILIHAADATGSDSVSQWTVDKRTSICFHI